MNICNNCGTIFEEPAEQKEPHYEVGGVYEVFQVCPVCNSDDYSIAFRCSKCGTYIQEQQSKFNMCEECEAETLGRFKAFVDTLTDDEKELCIWEGIA